ncbi:MAG: L-histidine N(alpha)-methyltransferase [Rhizobiales bacterium]|nr:L-histidine N(alpha)-methyltransferase [Hyphomicrobiales bacterium]
MTSLAKSVANNDSPTISTSAMAEDILQGLRATPKRIAAKYFYDAVGSDLFDKITEQPEYYPTRTEIGILRDNGAAIAALVRPGSAIVEFGSGCAGKNRILLETMPSLAAYVPVDICASVVEHDAARLREDFPGLDISPVAADFSRPFDLPAVAIEAPARVGFFPGSTIGNFEPHQAAAFFRDVGRTLGQESILIVGVDLIKSTEILHAAYNDAAGITARFNLNLLTRINRELGADFHLKQFEHHAFFNRERNRVEMHLASLKRQKVKVCGETIEFRIGETIHTENSYKYSVESFGALARGNGWIPLAVWKDADSLFSVQAFVFRAPEAAR